MTAKFDAFKAALEKLCAEHGVFLRDSGDYYGGIYVDDAEESGPYLDDSLSDATARSKLELAEKFAEREKERQEEARQRELREHQAERYRQYQDAIASKFGSFEAYLKATIEAQNAINRKLEMRISTDPADPAYVDDRPRRAWCNDVEIADWVIADEFRRVVIDKSGKVHNGAVLIERLKDGEPPMEAPSAPVTGSLSGAFVHVPDAPKAAPVVAAPAPAPVPQHQPFKHGKHRR